MDASERARQKFDAFLHGRVTFEAFESWLYENRDWLSGEIGDDTYVEIVSVDFDDPNASDRIRELVEDVLDRLQPTTGTPAPYSSAPVDRRPPQNAIEGVRERLRARYVAAPSLELQKAAEFVPEAMRSEEYRESEAGEWFRIRWVLIDSSVTSREVAALETSAPGDLPESYRAYLFAYCHLFGAVRSQRHEVHLELPSLPEPDPLRETRRLLAAWAFLPRWGYWPVGRWDDGAGPVCLDVGTDRETAPVVWFGREALLEIEAPRRADLAPNATRVYESFDGLLDDVFGRGTEREA